MKEPAHWPKVLAIGSLVVNIIQAGHGIYQYAQKHKLEEEVAAAEARKELFEFRRDNAESYVAGVDSLMNLLLEQLRNGVLEEDKADTLKRQAARLKDERERIIAQILTGEGKYRQMFDQNYKVSEKADLDRLLGQDPIQQAMSRISKYYSDLQNSNEYEKIHRLARFVQHFDDAAVTLVAARNANVRSGSDKDSERITAISAGTNVTFLNIEPSGSWVFVELKGGKQGWIFRQLLAVPSTEDLPGGVSIWI